MTRFDRHPWLWLLLGAALVALANLRFGVGVLAWVASAPFLRFLSLSPGWRSGASVLATLAIAWTLAVVKICTDPIPVIMAPMFGVPVALSTGLPMWAYAALRRRRAGPWTPLLFPAAMVVGEWAQHVLTPFGSWGAAAYTQLHVLPLLQIASVTGTAGVSFLVHLGSVVVAERLGGRSSATGLAIAAAGAMAATWAFGEVRLAAPDPATGSLRVAAVGTDATVGGLPLPDIKRRTADDDQLERRMRLAAASGASLLVSTEAASMTTPAEETAWLQRWQDLARDLRVHLVVSYVVPLTVDPLRFENKLRVLTPDGEVRSTWNKHHPVPGEPSVPGAEHPDPVEVGQTLLGTAICYDADFGRLGLAWAAREIDLLALPASDWRGIDPIHTEMTRLRAIEGGYGIIRSTRFGTSAVVDALGRVRGAESSFDGGARVLVAEVPTRGRKTVYSIVGDWFVALSAGAVAFASAATLRRRGVVT